MLWGTAQQRTRSAITSAETNADFEWNAFRAQKRLKGLNLNDTDRKAIQTDPLIDMASMTRTSRQEPLVTITFRHCGESQTHPLPAQTTWGELALQLQDRLLIPPYRLKLIVGGRRIDLDNKRHGTIETCNKQTILILGSSNATVALARLGQYNAEADEAFVQWRTRTYQAIADRLGEEHTFQLSAIVNLPLTSNKRRFGHLVNLPYQTRQDDLASLFGLGNYGNDESVGGLMVPALSCTCRKKLTSISCKRHIEVFLIGFFALIELSLNMWRARIEEAAEFETDRNKRLALLQEGKEWELRAARLQSAWRHPDVELNVLLDELVDIKKVLDFDPDTQRDGKTEASMLNEGPEGEDALMDLFSLETAIEILKGDYDPEDGERAFTSIPFLTYQRPK